MTKCLEGEWDFSQRIFLTPEEKDEKDKFAHLIDTVTAVKDKYISQAHKSAMCTEDNAAESIDTRLKKTMMPSRKQLLQLLMTSQTSRERRENLRQRRMLQRNQKRWPCSTLAQWTR